jgi:tetratricopeptide (TPR) repeat protein
LTAGSESNLTVAAAAGGASPEGTNRPLPVIDGYEVLSELGRGGMGVVYRARHIRLNRPCVLKMILTGVHADAATALRFLAEAEAVARLQHPNIVQIHHTGQADGLPFFELEYLDGGSLDRRLDGTPWPARRAVELVERLARGVAEAHRQGIIHRDLKPGNVLLATDGTPKVTDFGLAKLLNSDSGLTQSDSILGTPGYMAPEQAEGKARHVGPPADVYALGAILYELVTGRPPFRGATLLETLEQVKTIEPVPPSRLVPGLPRDIETIVLKSLQKEPGRRYESGAALAADLGRFLAGEPIVARPVPFWERGWRWCRRHPAPATLSATLVLVASLGLAGIVWQWNEAVKARDLASSRASAEAEARRDADLRRIEADKARLDAVDQRGRAESSLAESQASLALARKAVDDSFTKVSESKLMTVPGMRPLRRDLLESALAFYEEFVRKGGGEPSLLAELAATHARIGLIYVDLSEPDRARVALRHSVELYNKTLAFQPRDVGLLERLSDVWNALGAVDASRDPQAARAALQEAIVIRERLVAEHPGEPRFRVALSSSFNGVALLTAGDAQLDALNRSLELRLQLAGEIGNDAHVLHGLSALFNNINDYLWNSGHRELGLELLRRSIEYGRAGVARQPHDLESATDLAYGYGQTAGACWELGLHDEALAVSAERIAYLRKMTQDNPEIPTFRIELVGALARQGSWLVDLKRSAQAVSWLREAAEVLETQPDPDGTTLATGSTYRARAALILAGDVGARPLQFWPEAARRETEFAVTDLKRAVERGYRGASVVRGSSELQPLLARADVKGLLEEMDRSPAVALSAAAAPKAVPARLSSPLDKPGRLEEDRILGALAVALLGGEKTRPEQYMARLGAILARIDAQHNSRGHSPALERSAKSVRLALGECYASYGLWTEAAPFLARLLDPDLPSNADVWKRTAEVLLLSDDQAAYRALCARMRARVEQSTTGVLLPHDWAWAALLSPGGIDDPKRALDVLLRTKDIAKDVRLIHVHALALYRCDRYDEAVERLRGSEARDRNWAMLGLDDALLALALHRLGRSDEAEWALERAEAAQSKRAREIFASGGFAGGPESDVGKNWPTWALSLILCREATAAIRGKVSREPPLFRLAVARIHARLGRMQDAEADLEAAVAAAPHDPEICLARSRLLAELGYAERSQADFARALSLKSADPSPWIEHSRWQAARGAHSDAERALARAASLRPDELNHFVDAAWWVIGPYPEDLTLTCPPEIDPDPARPVAVVGSPDTLSWREASTGADGRVNFGAIFHAEHISAYALTHLYSRDDRQATLMVAGDDRMRVWLNGQLIDQMDGERAWALPPHPVPIRLRTGRNRLLIKVSNGATEHFMRVRIADDLVERASDLAALGLWKEAASVWVQHLDWNSPLDPETCRRWAPVLILAGDSPRYRRLCAEFFQRFGTHQPSMVSWACAATPDGLKDPTEFLQLADAIRDQNRREHWDHAAKGLARHRAGQYRQALDSLLQAVATKSDWQVPWPILAMTHERLGETAEAKRWLKKAEEFYDNARRSGVAPEKSQVPSASPWFDLALFQVLLREAEGLILYDPVFPANPFAR